MPRYRTLQEKEVEELSQYTEDDLRALEEEQFFAEAEKTIGAITSLDAKLRQLKKVYGLMQKARLTETMIAFHAATDDAADMVAELGELVFMQTKTKPRVNYSKVLKALLATQPELEGLIEELTTAATSAPGTQLVKHPRFKEPAAWKKKTHRPMRESAVPQPRIDADDVEAITAVIDNSVIPTLATLIDTWRAV